MRIGESERRIEEPERTIRTEGSIKLRIGEVKETDSPDVLLLDFDGPYENPYLLTEEITTAIHETLSFLRIGFASIKVEPSSGGKGLHGVVVLADDLPLVHRICLQLILGSDRKREAINFYRACQVNESNRTGYENVLYKRKETVVISNHGRHK